MIIWQSLPGLPSACGTQADRFLRRCMIQRLRGGRSVLGIGISVFRYFGITKSEI